MPSLSIGLSGVLVNQRLIDLAGHNITNADTAAYHRQVGDLVANVGGNLLGNGVDLVGITRVIDQLLENAITQNTSSQNEASTKLNTLNQLQAIVAPGDGSLHDTLANFFNAAEQLSAQPGDLTQRRVFLSAASDLTDRLNATVTSLDGMRSDLNTQANTIADQINTYTTQIGMVNQQIHDALTAGRSANDLLDQRDYALSKLSELVDVRTVPQPLGEINVFAGGTPLVLNASVTPVSIGVNSQNQLFLHTPTSQQAIDVSGGKLGGVLSLSNTVLPNIRTQFDQFADGLVTQLDHIQGTGLGLNGPSTLLTSQRSVAMPNLPLGVAKLPYPVKAGDLYVTVTNLATGQRTLNRLTIDPATQSLSGLASALSAIPHVQAVVDPQAGTLSVIAGAGYGFDFSGNFSTSPDTQAITGTTAASFSGQYTGAGNDTLSYRFVGSGTIGVTPNLAMEVRNGAGTLLTSVNVGQGYEAGADLPGVHGVKLNLSAGTVNTGDTFDLKVAADPDSAGVLPAIGLNSFFVGNGASGLHVNPDLLDHPENLALSSTGQPGDGTNLARLVGLRDQPILNNGTQTFQNFLEGIIGNVGSQAQDAQNRKSAFDALGQQLDTQRQGASGVDPNEELMNLVKYQRSYQMSAHFISTSNTLFDNLLQLLGP